ncbi:MAG: TrkH family potassium uptake protein [Sinobacteraceae bacterium]|nr:TrkH family potassium uptake protein [Nevskiaceae bacterium]
MLAVAHILGLMMAFFAVTFVMPMICAIITQDGTLDDFAIAAGINIVLGLAIAAATRRYKRELKARDGFLLVTLSWILMSLSAAVPLMIALPGISFTDAYFEAVSGLTTTGSTVITGLDTLQPSINLWRHALHWFGGIGIIVLAVAVLPLLGVGGMALYRAETPGPVKDEKLTPRITETAKALWLTYIGITGIGVIALRAAGMGWLDAICHSFSAMGLGGFSTRDASVGSFDSVAIEMVLIVLMMVATLNFSRHFMALRNRSLEPYRRDSEAKAILVLVGASVVAIALLLALRGTYPTFLESLRHSAFNVVSVASTTGFASQDFGLWPIFAPVWMLFLSCIVCSTGSTGGGIKMFRTLLLARQAQREMKQLVHPSAVLPIRIGGQVIPERIAASVLAFIFLYFQTIAALTFVLLMTGMPLVEAFTSVVASVNNLGPGIGQTGPAGNYQGLSDLQTWVCTVGMILGRLEIFSVLILFTATFWRK